MGLINARLKDALKSGAPPILFCEIDHPDGMVRVHSGIGTIRWDDKDWLGIHVLGRVSGVEQNQQDEVRESVFELRGVPPTSTAFLSANVRNRPARLWIGALDPQGRVAGEPELIHKAALDFQVLKLDEGSATIRIHATGPVSSVDRSRSQFWSDEDQKTRFPGDTGLSLLHPLQDQDVKWRLPA